MEKRQHPRFSFREPVAYNKKEGSPESGSLANDISGGGVRIRVQEFIPLNTVLDLKVHFTAPARTMAVKGFVVWVREVPHSEVYDVGIRFLQAQNITV